MLRDVITNFHCAWLPSRCTSENSGLQMHLSEAAPSFASDEALATRRQDNVVKKAAEGGEVTLRHV